MNAKPAIWILLGVLGTLIACSFPLASSAEGGTPFSFGVVAAGGYVPPSAFVEANLPFYALYPPVYYSYPIRYSYGRTPFAWGPYGHGSRVYGSRGYCADVPVARVRPRRVPTPLVVRNTYVRGIAAAEPAANRSARKPLRIVNPFVSPAKSSRTIPTALVGLPTALAELPE